MTLKCGDTISDMKDITPTEAVFNGLMDVGIDFIVSVPCVNLKDLIPMVDRESSVIHIPVTREEEGVGVCAGAYMGGKKAAILMQNSGLGNSINALSSLNLLYGIPLLMIISHRGIGDETICAQVPMGEMTAPLLDTLGISYYLPSSKADATKAVRIAWIRAVEEKRPVAILLPIPFWSQP
ncbi:MAG: sulfopyruvate decarboxylase subunit alpha [Methanohalophilus sp.]|nr:sulfopyruvate decarboxylase subunit alpha [Methanohalophilus sp.]